MNSVPATGHTTLCVQSRAGEDATIHLDIPVEVAGVNYNVVVVVQRARDGPAQISPSTFVLYAEVAREEDTRWFAEIREIPGAFAYGPNREEAVNHATAIALRILADRLEGVEEPGVDDSGRVAAER